MGDTVAAIQAFDRVVDPTVARIALVDTFKDEAEESLRWRGRWATGCGAFGWTPHRNADA